MKSPDTQQIQAVRDSVLRAVAEAAITDVHTHLYSPDFGELLLWGVDELLTYHYLAAETLRWSDVSYETYWRMSRREQADLVWKTLFVDHSPVSESCRGVLTTLSALGLDTSARDLEAYRAYYAGKSVEEFVDIAFDAAKLQTVVMTNDPFDDLERPVWLGDRPSDPRFRAALRIDGLLNAWPSAVPRLNEWGYAVREDFAGDTIAEVRRFLEEWLERMDAVYMAVSLPPTFAFPEDSPRGALIERCVLPVAAGTRRPFAMMVGVKKLTNPALKLAGDSVGKSDIDVIEHMCRAYPTVKFLVTTLSRENQHELCVAARKFRNLMAFGCWWFLNNPSLIEEITRMRLELLGLSVIPQHSDARVLDQVVYKWAHSRDIIADVLADKYADLARAGWVATEQEIQRDVAGLFGSNFWEFVSR